MAQLKKLYLGTNTKMYKTITQTELFLTSLCNNTQDVSREDLVLFVIPSFTALKDARLCVPKEMLRIGAQNMGWEEEGQYSGEISPLMLQEVGSDIVMIGHSDRRHLLHETDDMENKKVICALKHNLTPLLCIGETLEEKDSGLSDAVLQRQLKVGLQGVSRDQACNLWIAFEPVWAIGVNGIPATKEYAEEKHTLIRNTLIELFGEEVANQIPLLYGGSVNYENAPKLISAQNIDGLFIGRSAWDADSFSDIIHKVLPLWKEKKA